MIRFLRHYLWVFILTLMPLGGFSQSADSLRPLPADSVLVYSQEQELAESEAMEGADYGLGIMLLFFLVAMAISAVALCILLAIGVVLLILLTAWGVLTVSVLVGAYQKSFKKGFRAFWVLTSAFATGFLGVFIGILVFFAFKNQPFNLPTLIFMPAAAGLLGGGLFGFGSFQLLQYLFSRIIAHFNQKTKNHA